MKTLRYFLAALALCLVTAPAYAVNSCYWVGGTGNWSDGGNHWASATGGTIGTCTGTGGGAGTHYPLGTADAANFDANSGGGTATNDVSNLNIFQLNMGGYTGTLTNAVNNYNITLSSFSCSSGSSAGLNLGTGTWTITSSGSAAAWSDNSTCLSSLTSSGSTLAFNATSGGAILIQLGNHHYGTISLTGASVTTSWVDFTAYGGTVDTLNVSAPAYVQFTSNVTFTFTNPWNVIGTSSHIVTFYGSQSTAGAQKTLLDLSVSSASLCTYCAIGQFTIGQGTLTATSSFNIGNMSTSGGGAYSITAPSGGGGGYIIGGG